MIDKFKGLEQRINKELATATPQEKIVFEKVLAWIKELNAIEVFELGQLYE